LLDAYLHNCRVLFTKGDHVELFLFVEVKEKSLRFRIVPESVRVLWSTERREAA
jgi:hypothetical protein